MKVCRDRLGNCKLSVKKHIYPQQKPERQELRLFMCSATEETDHEEQLLANFRIKSKTNFNPHVFDSLSKWKKSTCKTK